MEASTTHTYWIVRDLGPEENDGVLHCITKDLGDGDCTYTYILATLDYAEELGHFLSYKDAQDWLIDFKQKEGREVLYINGKSFGF